MDMKKNLIEICRQFKIQNVGIAPVGPYLDLEKRVRERYEKGHVTGFENKDIDKLIDPRATMDDAKSVIVCLFPYYTGKQNGGNIAKYAQGKDYHIIVKEKLDKICEILREIIEDFKYMAFTDTGPLNDRYLAYLAGLGYYGWNQNIITNHYGSYVIIGYIINNYPFKPDAPLEKECESCGACVRACPGRAIGGNYQMEPEKCLSYITQKKNDLTEEDKKRIIENAMVFGCDVCQDVCPHNKNAKITPLEEFNRGLISNIVGEELQNLSNKVFKEKYGDRAFAWRGKKILSRNLEYIKKNNKD